MIGADRFVHNLSADLQAKHATQRYQFGVSDIDMWNGDQLIASVVVAVCDWHLREACVDGPWTLPVGDMSALLRAVRDGFAAGEDGLPKPSADSWAALVKVFEYLWD